MFWLFETYLQFLFLAIVNHKNMLLHLEKHNMPHHHSTHAPPKPINSSPWQHHLLEENNNWNIQHPSELSCLTKTKFVAPMRFIFSVHYTNDAVSKSFSIIAMTLVQTSWCLHCKDSFRASTEMVFQKSTKGFKIFQSSPMQ